MVEKIENMKDREKDLGLSDDEIAFYDALTVDDIIKEFMND